MQILPFILQLLALASFFVAAIGALPGRIQWGWLGMFLALSSMMVNVITLHPL